jgi:hypothetical protein
MCQISGDISDEFLDMVTLTSGHGFWPCFCHKNDPEELCSYHFRCCTFFVIESAVLSPIYIGCPQ